MEKRGFTLIEVLTSLAVFGIIFVAIGSVFYSVYLNWQKQRDFNQNFQNARWALEFMGNEIRHANSTDGLSDTESGQELLKFRIYQGGSYDSMYYWLNNTSHILYRCVKNKASSLADACSNSQSEMAPAIANAHFNASADLVTVELTIRPKPGMAEGIGNRNFTLETKARARN